MRRERGGGGGDKRRKERESGLEGEVIVETRLSLTYDHNCF